MFRLNALNMPALCFGGLLVSHDFPQLVAEVSLGHEFSVVPKWWNTVTSVVMESAY
jgi:hypothetical protein